MVTVMPVVSLGQAWIGSLDTVCAVEFLNNPHKIWTFLVTPATFATLY